MTNDPRFRLQRPKTPLKRRIRITNFATRTYTLSWSFTNFFVRVTIRISGWSFVPSNTISAIKINLACKKETSCRKILRFDDNDCEQIITTMSRSTRENFLQINRWFRQTASECRLDDVSALSLRCLYLRKIPYPLSLPSRRVAWTSLDTSSY